MSAYLPNILLVQSYAPCRPAPDMAQVAMDANAIEVLIKEARADLQ
jgi:hypothetical protein